MAATERTFVRRRQQTSIVTGKFFARNRTSTTHSVTEATAGVAGGGFADDHVAAYPSADPPARLRQPA